MTPYGVLQSETSDLSISLYLTKTEELHFWIRAGEALLGIESVKDIDELIDLLVDARNEAIRFYETEGND